MRFFTRTFAPSATLRLCVKNSLLGDSPRALIGPIRRIFVFGVLGHVAVLVGDAQPFLAREAAVLAVLVGAVV